MKFSVLWIAKINDANTWYHLYPFVESKYTSNITVVRKQKPSRLITNKKLTYVHFKGSSYFTELLNYFITGLKTLKNNNYDLIVSFSLVPWGVISWCLAKIFRKKILLGLIGSDFNKYVKNSRIKIILKFILRNSNYITVTGNLMKKELTDLIECKGVIDILPHCLPDELIFKGQKIFNNLNTLITVSELTENKRTIDIVKAVGLLKEENKNLKLLIVGKGPMDTYLKEYVEKNNLSNNIIFIGYVEDVKKMYLNANIFVQASIKEGLSLSLIESIGMELIPITTNAGCEKDIIKHGENGLFFNKRDVPDLANKIKYVLNQTNYNSLLNGVRITKDKLKIEFAIKKIEEIQRSLY